MGMIQIRNVPEDIHRKLKVRAAEAGMSLSDYLLAEIRELAEQPTLEELVTRIRSRPSVEIPESSAAIIRELREEMG